MSQDKAFIQEAKNEAEEYLGRSTTDAEWSKALPQAQKKLDYIIGREGDANGERRKPYYLGKLIEEAITAAEFSRWTQERSRLLTETTPNTLPILYTEYHAKVNTTAIKGDAI